MKELIEEIANGGGEAKVGGYDRLIYLDEKDGFYVGLMLTIKDEKTFCQIKRDPSKATKLYVNKIGEQDSLVDFNFFIINKKTKRGLYQYYWHSCSLRQFLSLLRSKYVELADKADAADIKKAGGKRAARAFAASPMFREESLDELLTNMESIKSFQFDYTAAFLPDDDASPLADSVTTESRSFKFKSTAGKGTIIKAIKAVIKSESVLNASVGAVESDVGLRRFILEEERNLESYGNQDFDDVTAQMSTLPDPTMIKEALCIKQMIKAAKDNSLLFE